MQIAQLARMPSSLKSDGDVPGWLSTSSGSCGQQVEISGKSHLLVHYGHEIVVIPWGIFTRLAVDCGDDHQLWLWLRKH